mgnify:CR=1 FL=1
MSSFEKKNEFFIQRKKNKGGFENSRLVQKFSTFIISSINSSITTKVSTNENKIIIHSSRQSQWQTIDQKIFFNSTKKNDYQFFVKVFEEKSFFWSISLFFNRIKMIYFKNSIHWPPAAAAVCVFVVNSNQKKTTTPSYHRWSIFTIYFSLINHDMINQSNQIDHQIVYDNIKMFIIHIDIFYALISIIIINWSNQIWIMREEEKNMDELLLDFCSNSANYFFFDCNHHHHHHESQSLDQQKKRPSWIWQLFGKKIEWKEFQKTWTH